TNLVADYAADQPEVLANLLMDADEKQFTVLYPRLKAHGQRATAPLRAELDRQLSPAWVDPPLDASWKPMDTGLVQTIETAHGLVAERFAFCQAMPLEEFLAVAARLRPGGYRPTRFRPFANPRRGGPVLVAAVWTRDGLEWQLAHDLDAADVPGHDAEYRARSYHPVDVSGY